jgi:3-oxoacyl-[acyl-carrier-protein] synthase III
MSFLRATGAYLPERVMTSEEIAPRLGVPPNWISNVSGIRERRIASESESIVAMGVAAARNAMARAGIAVSQVGALLVSSGTFNRSFPGPAVEVARELGLDSAFALDVPVASAGSIFAFSLADTLAERFRNVVVVATEKMSPIALREPLNRSIAGLFGDGAGACVISSETGFAKILGSVLHSNGTCANDLSLGFDGVMKMSGRSVIVNSTVKVPACVRELLQSINVAVQDVKAFVMHQANRHLMDRVAEALEVSPETFYSNIDKYGNTSSASLLIALHEWLESGALHRDQTFVLAGFGAGYHWGAAALRGC